MPGTTVFVVLTFKESSAHNASCCPKVMCISGACFGDSECFRKVILHFCKLVEQHNDN